MTYRTGNHWGVTIVREGNNAASHTSHAPRPNPNDQLVAVVVNGDQALAEHICTLLNGARTPDVDHTRGAAEALAHVRRQLDTWAKLGPHETVTVAGVHGMLRVAAAELGVDEQASPHPGETWRWPTECARCDQPIGPWSPDTVGSEMTHIVAGGGPDWEANRDHDPVADEHTEGHA